MLFLGFLKGSALCLSAITCSAALNIHMFRMALVITVVHTFGSLAIDADRPARML